VDTICTDRIDLIEPHALDDRAPSARSL
jgi:hypothetical protein